MKSMESSSTGLAGLDKVLDSLRMGDNVVWQVDTLEEYKIFTHPFVKKTLAQNHTIHYMRFGKHEPLLIEQENIVVHNLDAYIGFDTFSKEIYKIITENGRDAFYIFDCLSDLLSAWATDFMIGNFFRITCPYLYELNTIAYFAIFRNSHSFKTVARIRDTTQLLIDVYDCEGQCYVHPLKVQDRYSPLMFLPHKKNDDEFTAVTQSEDAAKFINHIQRRGFEKIQRNLDFWDKLFLKAEFLLEEEDEQERIRAMLTHLAKIMIGREEKVLNLAVEHFSLEDLIEIKNHMIGTGYIGGKSVGMLLARKILINDKSRDWKNLLEPQDSFYIGSDVFYSYIVHNGWWKEHMRQQTPEGYFTVAESLGKKMESGKFQEEIREQFRELIEYMGQSPIIVRSSSLLEDSFGNAFAGKYESYFLVNQGPPEQRYSEFINAVRKIYAGTMSEDALAYRLQRGLNEKEEQMALLVQRVSGSHHKNLFFPDIAGVGFSYNTYVWNSKMDSSAGMLRLVMGLGTRAVDRVEGDYPRIVALDDPSSKPVSEMKDLRKYSQHKLDILNIDENAPQTLLLEDILAKSSNLRMDMIGVRDTEAERRLSQMGRQPGKYYVITFDNLIKNTEFILDMKTMMRVIQTAYDYPVDIEFTLNFTREKGYLINLLQCRPHQIKGIGRHVEIPENVGEEKIFIESEGNFLGGSIVKQVTEIIFVEPAAYSALNQIQKYETARTIGRINRMNKDHGKTTMLIGPGRWGTTTPSLGVPIHFAEINNISILVELAVMSAEVLPELSFGTHFFQDLVETDIFYAALYPEKSGVRFSTDFLNTMDNRLTELLPQAQDLSDVVKVYDLPEQGKTLMLKADIESQQLLCYVEG